VAAPGGFDTHLTQLFYKVRTVCGEPVPIRYSLIPLAAHPISGTLTAGPYSNDGLLFRCPRVDCALLLKKVFKRAFPSRIEGQLCSFPAEAGRER
jgi:hypothetical protein